MDTQEEAGGNTKTSNKLKKPKAAPKALEFAKYSVRCTYDDGRPPCTTAVSGTGETAAGTSSAAAGLLATYTDLLASGRGADVLADIPSQIEVRVAFPRLPVADRQKLSVDMSHELVVVAAPGYRRLELFLPLPVRKTGTVASFDGLVSEFWQRIPPTSEGSILCIANRSSCSWLRACATAGCLCAPFNDGSAAGERWRTRAGDGNRCSPCP